MFNITLYLDVLKFIRFSILFFVEIYNYDNILCVGALFTTLLVIFKHNSKND